MPSAARRCALLALSAAILAAAACKDSVYTSSDPDVQVAASVVWAGGEIVLTSPAFVGPDSLPIVLLGQDTATAHFVPPDTVIATAPDTIGTFEVRLVFFSGQRVPVGTIRVGAAFVDWWEGPPVRGPAVPWPGRGWRSFLIGGKDHFLLVDPLARTTQTFLPDSLYAPDCLYGPGPAYGGGFVVMGPGAGGRGTCGSAVAYRRTPTGLAADSGPPGRWWQAAQLAPGDWLMASSHFTVHYIRHAAGQWTTTDLWCIEEPDGFVQSPSGDVALGVGVQNCVSGAAVFKAGTASATYYIEELFGTWGAAFTDGGDSLYVIGGPSDSAAARRRETVLAVVRSSDGELLKAALIPQTGDNILLDPGRRWMYVVGGGPRAALVHVFDRTTLRLVATMQPPAEAAVPPVPSGSYNFWPVLSAGDRRLYLVQSWAFGSTVAHFPLRVYAFRLLD